MALLPGIGCTTSSNVLARAGSRCLAAASHGPSSSPVFLLHVNGGGGGRQARLLSRKATGNAVGLLSGRSRRRDLHVVATAATANVTPASPRGISASDVLWPSAGAFLAMAVLGRIDQMMAFKGVSLTIAPLGAVCAVLFTAPDSPALFMITAAASLPLLFIDGPKFHNLQLWYALFPGAAGCAILCLIVS